MCPEISIIKRQLRRLLARRIMKDKLRGRAKRSLSWEAVGVFIHELQQPRRRVQKNTYSSVNVTRRARHGGAQEMLEVGPDFISAVTT